VQEAYEHAQHKSPAIYIMVNQVMRRKIHMREQVPTVLLLDWYIIQQHMCNNLDEAYQWSSWHVHVHVYIYIYIHGLAIVIRMNTKHIHQQLLDVWHNFGCELDQLHPINTTQPLG
jgi:hypothetical protein